MLCIEDREIEAADEDQAQGSASDPKSSSVGSTSMAADKLKSSARPSSYRSGKKSISSNVTRIQQFYLQERELFPAYRTLDEENFAANRKSHGPDLLLQEEEEQVAGIEAGTDGGERRQQDDDVHFDTSQGSLQPALLGVSPSGMFHTNALMMTTTLSDQFTNSDSGRANLTTLQNQEDNNSLYSARYHAFG